MKWAWRKSPTPTVIPGALGSLGGASGGNSGRFSHSMPLSAMVGASSGHGVSPVASQNANVGAPGQGTKGKPSDQRFRSFAERFMIARAHLFRADSEGLAEDSWQCILDARSCYNKIKEVGKNIEPEDGVF